VLFSQLVDELSATAILQQRFQPRCRHGAAGQVHRVRHLRGSIEKIHKRRENRLAPSTKACGGSRKARARTCGLNRSFTSSISSETSSRGPLVVPPLQPARPAVARSPPPPLPPQRSEEDAACCGSCITGVVQHGTHVPFNSRTTGQVGLQAQRFSDSPEPFCSRAEVPCWTRTIIRSAETRPTLWEAHRSSWLAHKPKLRPELCTVPANA
jgi:hypothetical protein